MSDSPRGDVAADGGVLLSTEDELKRAYKAFKKRLKLMKLDDESGLSRGSKRSGITGITPPNGFPPEIWEELVTQGKLKREARGIYALAHPEAGH